MVRRFPAGMHFGAAGNPDWVFEGIYAPDDSDYLRVFGYVRRVLRERLEVVKDEGEIFRIREALERHLELTIELITTLFPERRRAIDPVLAAAISTNVARLIPGARVTRIEEDS